MLPRRFNSRVNSTAPSNRFSISFNSEYQPAKAMSTISNNKSGPRRAQSERQRSRTNDQRHRWAARTTAFTDHRFRRSPRRSSSKCEEGLEARTKICQNRRDSPERNVKKRRPASSHFHDPGNASTRGRKAEDRQETRKNRKSGHGANKDRKKHRQGGGGRMYTICVRKMMKDSIRIFSCCFVGSFVNR